MKGAWLAAALCLAAMPARGETIPDRARAAAMARALLKTFPKPPQGWRPGRAPYYPDRAVAADQGAGLRWRYVSEAARTYISGRGAGAKRIQVLAQYAPPGWIREKRRQLTFFEKRAPHCVTRPKIKGAEAFLLGTFGTPTGKAKTCARGARLVVFAGEAIVTISTGQRVGAAGMALARQVDYAAMKKLRP